METPRFASSLSTRPDPAQAEKAAVEDLLEALDGERPDLLACFATREHASSLARLGPRLAASTGCEAIVGCTAESVIGGERELEREPGLSLWAARLPGTRVRPFHLTVSRGIDDGAVFEGAQRVEERGGASLLLLADPFTFPVDAFLRVHDEEAPGVPIVGGMASAGHKPGQNRLVTAQGSVAHGAVGALIEGGVEVRSVVSQGCRPVGRPWVITDCQSNLVRKLGGRPAGEVLIETFQGLDEDDRQLFQRAPFLGLAVDAARDRFERGDFLARGLLGMNPKDRTFHVADAVRRGQTVQFLVRDADSAAEDLRLLLRSHGGGGMGAHESPSSAGALLFSCNGRGTRMFPVPDHDVTAVRSGLAKDVPVAGFHAAGEIGPVGGRNFLHGFTASVAIFRPRAAGEAG